MDAMNIVRDLLDESDMGQRELSRRMNRSDNFIFSTLKRNTDPRISTFLTILHTLGYNLYVTTANGKPIIEVTKPDKAD